MKAKQLIINDIYQVSKKSILYPVTYKTVKVTEKKENSSKSKRKRFKFEKIKVLYFKEHSTWSRLRSMVNNVTSYEALDKKIHLIYLGKEKVKLGNKYKFTGYKFWCVQHSEFFYLKSNKLRYITE